MSKPASTPKTVGTLDKVILDLLVETPFFDSLDSNELNEMLRYIGNFVDVEKDEIVIREGEKGHFMGIIAEGVVEVRKESVSGKRSVRLATLSRGKSFGEMSLVDDFPRSATVSAKTPATLLILTRERFEQLLEKRPTIGVKILKAVLRLLSQYLRQTSSRLVDSVYTAETPA